MTCHVTLLASPHPVTLSVSQRNFLALHARHLVDRWQWYFVATQMRAFAGTKSATIWRDELDELVRLGLMEYGAGCAYVWATEQGKRQVLEG